jgi:hypothetical protein
MFERREFMQKSILLVLLAVTVSGCASSYRSIAVNNVGSGPIQNVNLRARSGGFDVHYGNLAVNSHPEIPWKVFLSEMRIKRTDVCIVNWTDASGQKRKLQVDLREQPQLRRGRGLLFNLQDDSVTVRSFKD